MTLLHTPSLATVSVWDMLCVLMLYIGASVSRPVGLLMRVAPASWSVPPPSCLGVRVQASRPAGHQPSWTSSQSEHSQAVLLLLQMSTLP
jgi:hypothetical protein